MIFIFHKIVFPPSNSYVWGNSTPFSNYQNFYLYSHVPFPHQYSGKLIDEDLVVEIMISLSTDAGNLFKCWWTRTHIYIFSTESCTLPAKRGDWLFFNFLYLMTCLRTSTCKIFLAIIVYPSRKHEDFPRVIFI